MERVISIKLLAGGLILASLAAQYFGYINTDSAWLLQVAQRVVGGEVLYKDVAETNPPLIVYLMMIPAYLAKITGSVIILWFKIFIFALAGISAFLCFKLTKDKVTRALIIFCLFFFAGVNFGQREDLFLIFFAPYLFLLFAKKTSVPARIFISIFAAIGICIKPYYLIIWGFAAIADAASAKDFKRIFKLENWIIGFIILFYLAFLFLVEKTYVAEILPPLLKYYGTGFDRPLSYIIEQIWPSLLCAQIGLVIFYFKFRKLIPRGAVIFSACNIGAIITVLLQQKAFTNHFMPADFFAILLNASLLREIVKSKNKDWKYAALGACAIALIGYAGVATAANIRVALRMNDEKITKKIELINKYASAQGVYYIGFDLSDPFPAILYSGADYRAKNGQLWILPGMYAGEKKNENNEFIYRSDEAKTADEEIVVNMVIGEMQKFQPEIVMVKADKNYASPKMGEYKFDVIKYFMAEKEFAAIWKNYQKLERIDEVDIYRYNPQR